MAEHQIEFSKLPEDVREKLAELDLELSEGKENGGCAEHCRDLEENGGCLEHCRDLEECLEIPALLLKLGAVVDEVDLEQRTPLFLAASNGNTRLMGLLVNHGANPDFQNSRLSTPLYEAVLGYRLEAAKLLVSWGGRIHVTRLASLAKGEWLEILIQSGFDLSFSDKHKWTALHWAASYNELEVIRNLLDAGIEVDSASVDGYTPLHMAVLHEKFDALRLLVERGADVNKLSDTGITPLAIPERFNLDGALWDYLVSKGSV